MSLSSHHDYSTVALFVVVVTFIMLLALKLPMEKRSIQSLVEIKPERAV